MKLASYTVVLRGIVITSQWRVGILTIFVASQFLILGGLRLKIIVPVERFIAKT